MSKGKNTEQLYVNDDKYVEKGDFNIPSITILSNKKVNEAFEKLINLNFEDQLQLFDMWASSHKMGVYGWKSKYSVHDNNGKKYLGISLGREIKTDYENEVFERHFNEQLPFYNNLCKWIGSAEQLHLFVNLLMEKGLLPKLNPKEKEKILHFHFACPDLKLDLVNNGDLGKRLSHYHHQGYEDYKLKWLGDGTQLIYLIQMLIKKRFIKTSKFHVLVKQHFLNNKGKPFDNEQLAKSKSHVKAYNNTNKPKEATVIDQILNSLL